MQTQHGPDDKRKPCGKKRKQKTPKTGPDRAPRHDKGVAKKSMVSELTGMKDLGKMDDITREGRYFIDRTIYFLACRLKKASSRCAEVTLRTLYFLLTQIFEIVNSLFFLR